MENNEEIKKIMEDIAEVDYLTGFLNRRGLYEYFEKLNEQTDIHFMFLDIDNFKSVNDTYGHAVGDKLLIAVSKMIKAKIGNSVLARIGGDEFVIVVGEGFSQIQIEAMAENIITSIDEIEISIEIKSIITFSIGVVLNQRKSMGMDTIMPKCDAAMYEAKRKGKNGYVLYSTIEDFFEMKQIVDREKAQALLDNRFEVRFVPIMNMTSTKLAAAKSYVVWNRWNEVWPEEKFLNILEENGFIVDLERYVFRNVCKILSEAKSEKLYKAPIIISISAISINHMHFVDELVQIIEEYGLSPDRFIIQVENISERADSRRITRFIDGLKQAGFRVSVKCFGHGSLSILLIKDLKLDYVIVDKNIADNVLDGGKNSLFVKNILSLINDLNIEPIVGGICDKTQIKYLTSYGCSLGSGIYFSEPLEADKYLEYAEKNISDRVSSVRFSFNNKLKDDSGQFEGRFLGNEGAAAEYVYDNTLGKNVLHLVGGEQFKNVVEFPVELMNSTSYSIVIRFRMESILNWSSIFYVMYENGFLSFMPYAWQGLPVYRIKDDMDENGWNDIVGNNINDDKWHIAVLTFNHKSSISRLYIDGKAMGFKENVLTLCNPKRVIVGGDIYVQSCEGYVDEVQFFDSVLDIGDIQNTL